MATATLVRKHQDVFGEDGFLNKYNINRRPVIEAIGLGILSDNDVYLLGDPGTGKTYVIELTLRTIANAVLFDILLLKDMSADDLLGPRSLTALKQDKIERIMDGFLPKANLAYLDEWDKANATALNSMLDLTSKRAIKVGGKTIDCSQLLAIMFSGNAMPDREDLTAITDRIGFKLWVPAVQSPEDRKAVMRIQLGQQSNGGIDPATIPQLSLDEIFAMKREVRGVTIPDPVIDKVDEAVAKFGEAGFPPSARKVGQMLRAIKARAWTRGADEASTDDMIVMAPMGWNHPDHARKAEDIIVEFASEFTRRAKYAREALEPIMSQLNDVKAAVDAAGDDATAVDDALQGSYDLLRNLRRLRRDTRQQIEDGRANGDDTHALDDVMNEIIKAEAWAESTFKGDDIK